MGWILWLRKLNRCVISEAKYRIRFGYPFLSMPIPSSFWTDHWNYVGMGHGSKVKSRGQEFSNIFYLRGSQVGLTMGSPIVHFLAHTTHLSDQKPMKILSHQYLVALDFDLGSQDLVNEIWWQWRTGDCAAAGTKNEVLDIFFLKAGMVPNACHCVFIKTLFWMRLRIWIFKNNHYNYSYVSQTIAYSNFS